MRWLPDGAKHRYQERADADQDCADERVSGEGFTQDQSSKDGIENKPGLVQQILAMPGNSLPDLGKSLTA